jgi:hypothetical protein
MKPDYHIDTKIIVSYTTNSIDKTYYIPLQTTPCYIFTNDLSLKQKTIENNTYNKVLYENSSWKIINDEKINYYKQFIEDLDLNINSVSYIEKQVYCY